MGAPCGRIGMGRPKKSSKEVKALNSVDFPTLGLPTIEILYFPFSDNLEYGILLSTFNLFA